MLPLPACLTDGGDRHLRSAPGSTRPRDRPPGGPAVALSSPETVFLARQFVLAESSRAGDGGSFKYGQIRRHWLQPSLFYFGFCFNMRAHL